MVMFAKLVRPARRAPVARDVRVRLADGRVAAYPVQRPAKTKPARGAPTAPAFQPL